jgi:hypothetical protein
LLLAKNHAHSEFRRRIPSSGQVDGLLKSLLGLYRVAKTEVRDAKLVMRLVETREFCNRLIKIGKACRGVSLSQQRSAFFECLSSFVGHSQFLHRNDVIVLRRGCCSRSFSEFGLR